MGSRPNATIHLLVYNALNSMQGLKLTYCHQLIRSHYDAGGKHEMMKY